MKIVTPGTELSGTTRMNGTRRIRHTYIIYTYIHVTYTQTDRQTDRQTHANRSMNSTSGRRHMRCQMNSAREYMYIHIYMYIYIYIYIYILYILYNMYDMRREMNSAPPPGVGIMAQCEEWGRDGGAYVRTCSKSPV